VLIFISKSKKTKKLTGCTNTNGLCTNGRSKWDQEPSRYKGLHTRCKFCLATPFHPELTSLAGASTLTSHPHNRSYMNMTAVQTKVVSSWNNMADILHHQILDLLVRKRSSLGSHRRLDQCLLEDWRPDIVVAMLEKKPPN
jgi:hypothetical protein